MTRYTLHAMPYALRSFNRATRRSCSSICAISCWNRRCACAPVRRPRAVHSPRISGCPACASHFVSSCCVFALRLARRANSASGSSIRLASGTCIVWPSISCIAVGGSVDFVLDETGCRTTFARKRIRVRVRVDELPVAAGAALMNRASAASAEHRVVRGSGARPRIAALIGAIATFSAAICREISALRIGLQHDRCALLAGERRDRLPDFLRDERHQRMQQPQIGFEHFQQRAARAALLRLGGGRPIAAPASRAPDTSRSTRTRRIHRAPAPPDRSDIQRTGAALLRWSRRGASGSSDPAIEYSTASPATPLIDGLSVFIST